MHVIVGLRLHLSQVCSGSQMRHALAITLGSPHDKISSSHGQHARRTNRSWHASATTCARRMWASLQVHVGLRWIPHFVSCDRWFLQCVPVLGRGTALLPAGGTWCRSIPRRQKKTLSRRSSRKRSGSADELSQVLVFLEWSSWRHDLLFRLHGGRSHIERALANRSPTKNNSRRPALPHRNAQRGPLERVSGHVHTYRRRPGRSVRFRKKPGGLVGERRDCDRDILSAPTGPRYVES